MNGWVVVEPLPDKPECHCGGHYFTDDVPEGFTKEVPQSSFGPSIVYFTTHAVYLVELIRQCSNDNPGCELHWTGECSSIKYSIQ